VFDPRAITSHTGFLAPVLPSAPDFGGDEEQTCAVCQDNIDRRTTNVRKLPSGHMLHVECIVEWVETNWGRGKNSSANCPLCWRRYRLRRAGGLRRYLGGAFSDGCL
jgi:hypothetical protein